MSSRNNTRESTLLEVIGQEISKKEDKGGKSDEFQKKGISCQKLINGRRAETIVKKKNSKRKSNGLYNTTWVQII